jgi:hypothetical protein
VADLARLKYFVPAIPVQEQGVPPIDCDLLQGGRGRLGHCTTPVIAARWGRIHIQDVLAVTCYTCMSNIAHFFPLFTGDLSRSAPNASLNPTWGQVERCVGCRVFHIL